MPFVSITELEELTGLPERWLRAEVKAGRIPSVKVGDQLLFHPQSVEQAVLANADLDASNPPPSDEPEFTEGYFCGKTDPLP